MNFEITASQESFFNRNGQIAFEGLFTEEELSYLATLKKGYNHWQSDERIKKIVLSKDIGKLIFALTQKRPARLLFDRIAEDETINLQQVCFQGVLIGVLISLTSNLITFISADKEMVVEAPHLLIVYGESNVRYIFCENDSYAPFLKKKGYVYGDQLKMEDSPYLYR